MRHWNEVFLLAVQKAHCLQETLPGTICPGADRWPASCAVREADRFAPQFSINRRKHSSNRRSSSSVRLAGPFRRCLPLRRAAFAICRSMSRPSMFSSVYQRPLWWMAFAPLPLRPTPVALLRRGFQARLASLRLRPQSASRTLKRQRRHAVVPRDHDVSAPAQIDQRDVHRVRAGADHRTSL